MAKRKRIDLELLKELWAQPENWGKNLKEMCELLGWKYSTVKHRISTYGADKFHEERNMLLKRNLQMVKDTAYKALLEKVQAGNVKAIEMVLKMTGDLTDKVEISGNIKVAVIVSRKFIGDKDGDR